MQDMCAPLSRLKLKLFDQKIININSVFTKL